MSRESRCSDETIVGHDAMKGYDAVDGRDTLTCSCGRVYGGRWAKGNWQRHLERMRADTENRQLICTYCGSTFTRSDNLRSHCKAFHSAQDCHQRASGQERSERQITPSAIPGQQYECPTCGKKFSKQDAYNEHVATQHTQQG